MSLTLLSKHLKFKKLFNSLAKQVHKDNVKRKIIHKGLTKEIGRAHV